MNTKRGVGCKTCSVLVVEDSLSHRPVLVCLGKLKLFCANWRAAAVQAIELAQARVMFDLIFYGFRLTRCRCINRIGNHSNALSSTKKPIPFVIVYSLIMIAIIKQRCFGAGMQEFIIKP